MGDLLALSFLQPWLWAILEGHKPVENRRWKPHAKMIGQRFALHASAGLDPEGARFIADRLKKVPVDGQVPRSAILGTARLVGAIEIGERLNHQRWLAPEFQALRFAGPLTRAQVDAVRTNRWTFGPWAWLLADVVKLPEPISCKGALGFWKVPTDIAARIAAPGPR